MEMQTDWAVEKLNAPPELLGLGSDKTLRAKYFSSQSFSHPAKLNLHLALWLLKRYTRPGDRVADPMCGIASILIGALLGRHIIAREVEPHWLALAQENAAGMIGLFAEEAGTIELGQADARPPWGFEADHLMFSPPYGCQSATGRTSKGYISQRARRLESLGANYSEGWPSKAPARWPPSCSTTVPTLTRWVTTGANATGRRCARFTRTPIRHCGPVD